LAPVNFFNLISDREKSTVTFFYLGIISLFFSWIMNPFGPGISNDSLLYLETGNHLFTGNGFSVIGHNGNLVFASDRFPVYPVLLKLFSSIGLKPAVIQILLFTEFAFLVVLLLFSFSEENNKWLTIIFSALALLYPFILVYFNLWTESVYLILLLMIILAFNSDKKLWLILFLLVMLSLTRMAGITVGISIALTWIVLKKYSKAMIAFCVSVLPVITWWYAGIVSNPENSRQLNIHWITPFTVRQFFECLGSLISLTASFQLFLGIAIFILPAILYYRNSFIKNYTDKTFLFLISMFYVYPLFLFFSISFIDYSTPMDYRILAPELLIFLLILTNWFLNISSVDWKKSIPLIAVLCLSCMLHAKDYINLHENGSGYNSKEDHSFKFNDVIRKLPKDVTWYTNMTHGIYFKTGKIAHELPLKFDIHKNVLNESYQGEWKKLSQTIQDSSGIIIWIRSGAFEKSFISYDELKATSGFVVLYDDWLCLILSNPKNLKLKPEMEM
jgi:hypothetical protein